MDTSCRVSQIGDSIEAREQGILNSHARKVSEKEMRPELGKTCDRPSIYPWVSPLILLYHTGAIFPWTEKLEDKPEIKKGLPPSRMWWKNRRLDQADRRLRKCRPNDQEHQTDRPEELMTKSKLSTLRRPKKLRSSQGMSHDWIWQHTGANFSKGVSKNFKGETAQHSDGCLDSRRRGQKQKFGFCIDTCDSTLGQIFQSTEKLWRRAGSRLGQLVWTKPRSMCMKSLETRTDQDNAILGQNFSIFEKLEKFVSIFHTGQKFFKRVLKNFEGK